MHRHTLAAYVQKFWSHCLPSSRPMRF